MDCITYIVFNETILPFVDWITYNYVDMFVVIGVGEHSVVFETNTVNANNELLFCPAGEPV